MYPLNNIYKYQLNKTLSSAFLLKLSAPVPKYSTKSRVEGEHVKSRYSHQQQAQGMSSEHLTSLWEHYKAD